MFIVLLTFLLVRTSKNDRRFNLINPKCVNQLKMCESSWTQSRQSREIFEWINYNYRSRFVYHCYWFKDFILSSCRLNREKQREREKKNTFLDTRQCESISVKLLVQSNRPFDQMNNCIRTSIVDHISRLFFSFFCPRRKKKFAGDRNIVDAFVKFNLINSHQI